VYQVECVVVGAGVVGLAVARELALSGREVIVLEAEAHKGMHASSRNTSVIHAGINYIPGSLKSRLCAEGKRRLYAYCEERGLPHRRIGKLIPLIAGAGEAGLQLLKRMQARAAEQGLVDLHLLTADEAVRMEPELLCDAALWSPTSGIIDVHAYMDALEGELRDRGGAIAYAAPLISGAIGERAITLNVGDKEGTRISCRMLVNAAGFNAPSVAARLNNRGGDALPPRLLAKGTYCVLARPSPFSHLIYPAPHGVHASLDLGGQLRFGPDSEWIETVDYKLDEARIAPFYEKIRAFWPGLRDGDLAPGWTGIRAKISAGKTNETDFRIDVARNSHTCLIDLFGIDSPGLTASMGIAAEVARLAGPRV
jgi:L-2-hydroxyglutarate oxidase LhgO